MFMKWLRSGNATEADLAYLKNSCPLFQRQLWAYCPEVHGQAFSVSLESKTRTGLFGRQYQDTYLSVGWKGRNGEDTPRVIPRSGWYVFKTENGDWLQVKVKHTTFADHAEHATHSPLSEGVLN